MPSSSLVEVDGGVEVGVGVEVEVGVWVKMQLVQFSYFFGWVGGVVVEDRYKANLNSSCS